MREQRVIIVGASELGDKSPVLLLVPKQKGVQWRRDVYPAIDRLMKSFVNKPRSVYNRLKGYMQDPWWYVWDATEHLPYEMWPDEKQMQFFIDSIKRPRYVFSNGEFVEYVQDNATTTAKGE